MSRLLLAAACAGALSLPHVASAAPAREMTNSIGMQLVRIEPGAMQVGVFTPGCPNPNAPPPGPPGGAAAAVAAAAAAAPGAAPAAPRPPTPPPTPPDPRSQWTPADYAACARMTAADRSEGFRVQISKPYYVGKYEVTQAQYSRVMGKNPSKFQGAFAGGDSSEMPVDSVTWADAQAFVAALNRLERTGSYRLPTEFEWEYACRAGGAGQQSWAEVAAMSVDAGTTLGFGFGAQGRPPRNPDLPPPTTAKVGSKRANAWGVHDMLGNVWEWVQDPYNGKIFADPRPARNGDVRVLKGGGFVSDVKNAICATHGAGPGDRWDVGFRIVKDAE